MSVHLVSVLSHAHWDLRLKKAVLRWDNDDKKNDNDTNPDNAHKAIPIITAAILIIHTIAAIIYAIIHENHEDNIS